MNDQKQHPMVTARQDIDRMSGEFARVLPPGITGEMFARVSITALQNRPALAMADRHSLFNALMKAAEDGLLPDGREGVLNIYNTKLMENGRPVMRDGKEVWIQAVQWLPMVEGVRKLMWNAGITMETGVVYSQDKYDYRRGDDPRIIHTPMPGPRSKANMVAVYSIARFPDGRVHRDWMWKEEVEQVRTTYSRSAEGKAWKDDTSYPEMAIKTVVHHHSKSLPSSTALREIVSRPEFWDTPAERPEQPAPVVVHSPQTSLPNHVGALPMEPVQAPERTVEGAMNAIADGNPVEQPTRQRRTRQTRTTASGGNGNSGPAPTQAGGGGGAATDTDGTRYDRDTGEVIEDHEAQEAAASPQGDGLDIPPSLQRRSQAEELQILADSAQPESKDEYVPWFETKLEFAKTREQIEALRQYWSLTGGLRKQWGIVPADYKGLAGMLKEAKA